ncbi:MAG: hypothetical protein U0802_12235 [Candidatus Binatia bacterium]
MTPPGRILIVLLDLGNDPLRVASAATLHLRERRPALYRAVVQAAADADGTPILATVQRSSP